MEGIQCPAQRHFSRMHSVTHDGSTEVSSAESSCLRIPHRATACAAGNHTLLKAPLLLPGFSFFPHSLMIKPG